MHVSCDDGTEVDIRAGDLMDVAPGHDAWVTGDEPCILIDVSAEATTYATGRPAGLAAPEDRFMQLVRRGYAAFNSGDIATLTELFTSDVTQHVPGSGPLAGTYKGVEAVLGYYAALAERTDGTFRAHLMEVHGDGHGHVTAIHQTVGIRNGAKRISRGSILFTFVGERASDLLELRADIPGDDAFLA